MEIARSQDPVNGRPIWCKIITLAEAEQQRQARMKKRSIEADAFDREFRHPILARLDWTKLDVFEALQKFARCFAP